MNRFLFFLKGFLLLICKAFHRWEVVQFSCASRIRVNSSGLLINKGNTYKNRVTSMGFLGINNISITGLVGIAVSAVTDKKCLILKT